MAIARSDAAPGGSVSRRTGFGASCRRLAVRGSPSMVAISDTCRPPRAMRMRTTWRLLGSRRTRAMRVNGTRCRVPPTTQLATRGAPDSSLTARLRAALISAAKRAPSTAIRDALLPQARLGPDPRPAVSRRSPEAQVERRGRGASSRVKVTEDAYAEQPALEWLQERRLGLRQRHRRSRPDRAPDERTIARDVVLRETLALGGRPPEPGAPRRRGRRAVPSWR